MKRSRLCVFALMLAGSIASAAGANEASAAGPDLERIRLDASSALALASNEAAELQAATPERVTFYVSQAGQSHRRIRSVQLSLDDQPSVRFALDDAQATEIAEYDDLRRLHRSALSAGLHQVHAELVVSSGKPDAKTSVVSADYALDKLDGPLDVELRFDPAVLIGSNLKVRAWRGEALADPSVLGAALNALPIQRSGAVAFRLNGDQDPALRHVRHLERTGEFDRALVELLAMQAAKPAAATLSSEYWFEVAHTTRAMGLLDRAEAVCDDLDTHTSLAAAVATERLALANAFYERGALDRAEVQLKRARAALPEFRLPDWRYVSGMLALARGQSAEAAAMLGETSSETIEAFRYMSASADTLHTMAYSRFNLAVAMVRTGDERRGLSWLDLLGRSAPTDAEMFALRDKANLALGWHFLKAKQGRTALGVLGRIRSEGPLSDRALLGMGWAQLAPNGERLPRVQLGQLVPRAPDQIGDLPAPLKNSLMRLRVLEPELSGVVGPQSFERDDPPKDKPEGLRRALKIWSVLLQRDSREPAVIEAMLATAYAQDQLGNTAEARQAYSDAIANLRRVREGLAAESRWVGEGQFLSALAASSAANDPAAFTQALDQLHLPPADDTGSLYAVLEQYRDFSELQRELQVAQASIAERGESAQPARAALNNALQQLAETRESLGAGLQQIASRQISTRVAMLDNYLKSALLMAARTEEQPVLESRLATSTSQASP